MKKKFFWLVALCVIFTAAFTMTGCPESDSKPKPKPGPNESTDATLTEVKFGNEVATLGTPAATYGNAIAGTVVILQSSVNVTYKKGNADASVDLAVVKAGATLVEDDLWSDTDFTDLATGDAIAIRVTAEDGKTKLYYKIGITLADVALQSLDVGGKTVVLPNAGTSWQTAASGGYVLFAFIASAQPADGTVITAVAKTQGATIKYGRVAAGSADAPTFNPENKIIFEDGDFLYIQVTGASGDAFYKVTINFRLNASIKYGSPAISADHTTALIDALWNDSTLQTYPIRRIYTGDSAQLVNPENGLLDENGQCKTTQAFAKALWDESGLYIYLDVNDSDMSEVDNEHNSDSFELFVNEGLPNTSYTNGGSQYRLALNGQVSGEGGSPAAMRDLNKWAVWKKADNSGYVMVLQAPWRLRNKFFAANTYRNDWEFGFELQINVAAETGTRYGVLVWNNIDHSNYQNATDYGNAKLTGAPAVLNFPALPPVISTHPQGGAFSAGDPVSLSVVATTIDTGTLSYQWYSAETATGDGTLIAGATSATYAFSAPATTTRYFAIVTNTLGTTKAVATSGRATITVASVPMIDQLTLGQSYAVYKFTLPAGATFGEYTSIKADYFMDAENFAKTVRSVRLMGNYSDVDEDDPTLYGGTSLFTVNSSNYFHFGFDTANAAYIYDDIGAGAIATAGGAADTWFTLTYKLVGNSPNQTAHTTDPVKHPIDGATGTFYFGIGIPGYGTTPTAPSTPGPKVQLVKNITMVHETDATKNVVTKDFFGFVGYANAPDGLYEYNQIPDPDGGGTVVTDYVKEFSPPQKNAAAAGGNYQSLVLIDLGEDFDITQYTYFTFEVKYYKESSDTPGEYEIADPANGLAQMKWRDTTSTTCATGAGWRWDLGNIGDGSTVNTKAKIPDYLMKVGEFLTDADAPNPPTTISDNTYEIKPLRYLDFENASADIKFIEVSKITFFVDQP